MNISSTFLKGSHMQTALRPIAVRNASGVTFRQPILPNCWKGEKDCIVGPFSGKSVAEYFANYAVDFGQYEGFSYRMFVKGVEWYIEVNDAAPLVAVA
jgi:hypothetical protein